MVTRSTPAIRAATASLTSSPWQQGRPGRYAVPTGGEGSLLQGTQPPGSGQTHGAGQERPGDPRD